MLKGRFGVKCDDLKLIGNEADVNSFADQEKLLKHTQLNPIDYTK